MTWIGLQNPLRRPGKWMWTDGSPYNYTFWESQLEAGVNMPDNYGGNQYCTIMKLLYGKGKWDDISCEVPGVVTAICQL
ncbi:C-type lectin protein, partial [Aphelenchoides avenae]